MIVQAVQNAAFWEALGDNPGPLPLRLRALWKCYGEYPALCGFYTLPGGGALAVPGKTALLAGDVDEEQVEELIPFLHFAGVETIEHTGEKLARVGEVEAQIVMRREGDKTVQTAESSLQKVADVPVPLEQKISEKILFSKEMQICASPTAEEVYSVLQATGPVPSFQDFYAEYHLRRNRGLAYAVTIAQKTNRETLASAAIWAQNQSAGYLSLVATLPAHRNRGLASALVQHLIKEAKGKTFWAVCTPQNELFYRQHGFQTAGTQYRTAIS